MPDPGSLDFELDFALDDTLAMLESSLSELIKRSQEAIRGIHSIHAMRDAGDRLEMHVNAGGVIQELTRVERYVGQLDALVRVSSWRDSEEQL